MHMRVKSASQSAHRPYFKTLFKGLALTIGAGLLLRAGARSAQTGNPVVERLDRAERKLTVIEQGRSSSVPGEAQDWIQKLEQRTQEQINAVSARLDAFQHHVPELINTAVTTRVQEVEQRIAAEIRETQSLMVKALVETIDARVTKGMAHVKSSLLAHSQEISELTNRMNQTDANLVRILRILEGTTLAATAQGAAEAR